MRSLLAQPAFTSLTDQKSWNMFPWTMLRIDQGFRLHEKNTLSRLLQLTYELDALLSMAHTTRKHNLVMPALHEGALQVQAEAVFHPLIENAVANPVNLNQQQRFLFLTGPNMAGKTTYLRACGVALYMAHLGMGVPATSFSFSPAQRLFSAINLADNLNIGVSYFRAEALRMKTIAKALSEGYRVVAILDEPFKGTNVKDALDASIAIMLRFANREDCLFMFSSHLIEMEEKTSAHAQVDSCYFEAEENAGPLSFDYVLKPGVSSQRLGMRVLREEGIFDLLDKNSADD
jgi:DNA mismatch repair ATPase MutS